MVVDAERDVDVGMHGEGVEAGAERDAEAAAAIDPPAVDRSLEGLGEALDEAVAAAARVGQPVERDEQDARRLDLAGQRPAGAVAELAAGREIVGADIDAAVLLRGLGQERNVAAPRHAAQRVGAAPLDRRKHDGVDIADLVVDELRCLFDLALVGAARPRDAAMGALEDALGREFRDVAAHRHARHPAETAGELVDRQLVAFVEQRYDLRMPMRLDHIDHFPPKAAMEIKRSASTMINSECADRPN